MFYCDFANQKSYPFDLIKLPFSINDFESYVSQETFQFHYGMHHAGYVKKLNALLQNEVKFHNFSLEKIILQTCNQDIFLKIFNNASQIWNHNFFWYCIIKPNHYIRNVPYGNIKDLINESFGNFSNFQDKFISIATEHFGSGWIWIVGYKSNSKIKLDIVSTQNSHVPFLKLQYPLCVCDLWEHAYYIDYRNDKIKYINIFLDKLVNWHFVNLQIDRILKYPSS